VPQGDPSGDMIQGMLDMLILKALSLAPMHGWGITERIHQGSLYPALYRLKRQGWIASDWRTTENNRRARYYSLTAAGRRQLAAEQRGWERLSRGIELVLGMEQPS
jgi:PadR family transcriptional regulator PadR